MLVLTDIDERFMAYIARRNPDDHERHLIRRFSEIVLGWEGVYIAIGQSRQTDDGLVDKLRVMKRRSGFGAAATLRPHNCRIDFRLADEHASDRSHIRQRDVRPEENYRLSMMMTSDEALQEAIELTREAFEAMGAA